MWIYPLILVVSFLFTLVSTKWFIPKLRRAGLVVKDQNKLGKPDVPEMGGLPLVGGFAFGVVIAIAVSVAFASSQLSHMHLELVLASLSTIFIMAIIGVIDDLLMIHQRVKAFIPIFAAFPLMAVQAGVNHMELPLFGIVDFNILYPILLIPLAITGASNATNMLAGFNGLEAGLGAIMCATIAVISIALGRVESAVLVVAMLGALLAFLVFNWYPAKILIGDVGTLSIGAVVASAVIVGNIEKAGVILIIPFFLELYLKAKSRFKANSWCDLRGGLLICQNKKQIFGLGRLFMYLTGGLTETRLVINILLIEMLFSILALYSYFGPKLF